MKLPRPTRYEYSDESLLPLINVVFLLLIFFIMLGALQSADVLKVEPPVSEVLSEAAPEPAVLLINAQGEMALDSRPITRAELLGALKQGPATDTALMIKADAALSATMLVDLLKTLREAGIDRVQLLTHAH